MHTRPLGSTGLTVSEIGFGGWAIGGGWGEQRDADSLAALHAAIDSGVTFIDTAAGYGNGHGERLIGQVLAERSETVHVATKTPPAKGPWPPRPWCRWQDRYPEEYLRANVDERLRELGCERLDLLQLHTWTRAWNYDPVPFQILAELKRAGKIGAVGVSTPEHDQNAVIELMRGGHVDVVQVIYNIFEQEPAAELLPVAQETGTGVIVRVVFDEGVLTGKYSTAHAFPPGDFRIRYFAGDRLERAVERVERLRADFRDDGLSLPELAIAFALAHPAVSCVIPGARNPDQARANAAVSDLPRLSAEQLERLRAHAWLRAWWYGGK